MTAAQHEAARRVDAAGAGLGVVELVGSVPLAGRGAVDSDQVDDREQLRACVSALAYLARQLPGEESSPPRHQWWRQVLVRRPPQPTYVRAPLDELVGAWWQQRVRAGSGVRWRRVWDALRAADALPRIEVVAPLRLDPVGTDLLRRVNQALGSAPAHVRSGSHRVVRHRDGEALGVPASHLGWAVARAEREGLVVPSTDPARRRRVTVVATLERAIEELAGSSSERAGRHGG